MALPTSKTTRFVGSVFVGDTPPSVEELGRPLQAGDIYLDNAGSDLQFCAYNGSTWDCILLNAAPATTTSTTTTTSTSTTAT